ncbi:hypothetical protein IMSAG044_01676 [Lactobacillaceae bacterium]|uniref:hypothetical protein n=1 Tax=Lactobacillus intestinalis TaxID=151781 RepID=UPI0014342C37|nr:hypothetical protein [Lactobacillus intestinalis]GFI60780.1 hypothetical protein IMSAG044_01676 [Lactobacillaceae bacterium]
MSESSTIKVQANVNKEVVKRVNTVLKSIGQSPTSIINSLYHAIDNTGKVPFEIGLTPGQKASIDLQQLTASQPVKIIHNAEEFEKIWEDEDKDED